MNIGSTFVLDGVSNIIIGVDDRFVMSMRENSVVLRAIPIDKLRNIIDLERDEDEFIKAVSFSEFYSLLSIYCRKKYNVKNVINEIHEIWVDSSYDNNYLRSVVKEAELLAKNKDYESESPTTLLRSIRKYL